MSLILDALKRLEAKAPPKPVAPDPMVVESQPEVETATVLPSPQPSPEGRGGYAPDLENPASDSEPIVLESVAISAADSPPEDWFEQTEICLSGPELTEHNVDVQISLAALAGDVLNLDLEVRQPAAELVEAEIVEPSVEVQELTVEEPQNPGPPAGHRSEEASVPVIELPRETLDFAAEIAKLWTASDEEIAAEPAPPAAEFVSAELVEEEPVHDPAPDEIISFGTLDDEVLPINANLPVEVIESVAEEASTDDFAESAESHVAPIEERHEETVEEDAAEAEMPSDAILPIADFRPAVAELAEPERDDLVDDHDVLAAQLTELEFRGLRDNVLSQLPDAPAALLFAAADDETDVADVVLKLSQSLAQLRQGEVAIVCSTRLRDAYRASNDYGELQQAIIPSSQRQHRVPTVLIDAKDAGDRMVADLKRRCRWVLFAADAATARRWSPLCEATYVVVGLGNTDRWAAAQTVASLELAGGLVLGCVLTDVPDVA